MIKSLIVCNLCSAACDASAFKGTGLVFNSGYQFTNPHSDRVHCHICVDCVTMLKHELAPKDTNIDKPQPYVEMQYAANPPF